MAVRGKTGLTTKVAVFVICAFVLIVAFSRLDFGADESVILDLKRQVEEQDKEHKAIAKKLANQVNIHLQELGKPTVPPAELISRAAAAVKPAVAKPPASPVKPVAGEKPPTGKKTKKPKPGKPTAATTTVAPAANDETTEAPAGDSLVVEGAPADSPESNKVPEDARTPDERNFKHFIGPLKALPADASDEMKQVYTALNLYNSDRTSKENIPVYGTACVAHVDCKYVRDQLKSLDTGVGHIVVVMNKESAEHLAYFRSFEAQFPGRFHLAYRPIGGGCSESWNIMMRLGFAITPQPNFVMATNGDLWALPGNLKRFAKFMNENLDKHVGSRFVHFSSFALNKRGWEILGPFDESIFPAYAEDVEYHIRAVSAGVMIGSYPDSQQDRTFKHVGSPSFGDKVFNEMYSRWDKSDYMFRKWGVDMRMYSDYQHCHPFKHPWNQPSLTHRTSWVVDPGHRHCIRTGEGIRHNAHHGGCFNSVCNSCWYNASVLLKILPPGTQLPDNIMTQNRVRY